MATIDRNDILASADYWRQSIELDLYNCAMEFMERNHMNRATLAQYLGVTRGYVTQLLNGNFDHRLSKVIELALALGYTPDFKFVPKREPCHKSEELTALTVADPQEFYRSCRRES